MKELIRFLQALLGRNTVYYIGGSDVLPHPERGGRTTGPRDLETGDENAKQLLIERNLRLVVFLARRFEKPGSTEDPDLHRHHWAYQGHQHLPAGPEHQAGYLRLPVHRERNSHAHSQIAPLKLQVSWMGPSAWTASGELLLSDVLGHRQGDMILKPLEDDVDLRLLHQAIREALPGRSREIVTMRASGLGAAGGDLTQKSGTENGHFPILYFPAGKKRIMLRLEERTGPADRLCIS